MQENITHTHTFKGTTTATLKRHKEPMTPEHIWIIYFEPSVEGVPPKMKVVHDFIDSLAFRESPLSKKLPED
jgi:ribulose-5-phosphate 4-epimerase/fuculose-1-phosphate aldolase